MNHINLIPKSAILGFLIACIYLLYTFGKNISNQINDKKGILLPSLFFLIAPFLFTYIVTVDLEKVDVYAKVLQTLVIGIIGSIIAYKQYESNQQKLLIDLYNRRIKIYNYVIELFRAASIVNPNNKSTFERNYEIFSNKLSEFDANIYEVDFLFSESFCKDIYEFSDKCVELINAIDNYQYSTKEAQQTQQPSYREGVENLRKMREIQEDLIQQRDELKSKFYKEGSKALPFWINKNM